MPEEKSVIAFDNSFTATVENLASYDFDLGGIMYQALSFAAGRMGEREKRRNLFFRGWWSGGGSFIQGIPYGKHLGKIKQRIKMLVGAGRS
jgi:hypothetical protein